jgi:hypothetical protein
MAKALYNKIGIMQLVGSEICVYCSTKNTGTFVDSPESTCCNNRSQFKMRLLFKQSGPDFHIFRYVHWNDFVVMNCYCLLTVLERSLKILKHCVKWMSYKSGISRSITEGPHMHSVCSRGSWPSPSCVPSHSGLLVCLFSCCSLVIPFYGLWRFLFKSRNC